MLPLFGNMWGVTGGVCVCTDSYVACDLSYNMRSSIIHTLCVLQSLMKMYVGVRPLMIIYLLMSV